VKCNGLIQVFAIASVIKAGGESICKLIQRCGPIWVTDRVQSQHFPLECNGLVQVFNIASTLEASVQHYAQITKQLPSASMRGAVVSQCIIMMGYHFI
jgi:hypothetical protein